MKNLLATSPQSKLEAACPAQIPQKKVSAAAISVYFVDLPPVAICTLLDFPMIPLLSLIGY